jgi:hypothetical protein
MPSATLNLLGLVDAYRSLATMRITTVQIAADRGTGRNPGATGFVAPLRGTGAGHVHRPAPLAPPRKILLADPAGSPHDDAARALRRDPGGGGSARAAAVALLTGRGGGDGGARGGHAARCVLRGQDPVPTRDGVLRPDAAHAADDFTAREIQAALDCFMPPVEAIQTAVRGAGRPGERVEGGRRSWKAQRAAREVGRTNALSGSTRSLVE